MVNGPASTFGQFSYHIVAVTEQCDVEVDVVGWFARDVDLRHLFVDIVRTVMRLVSDLVLNKEGKEALHLGDRGDFHRCANDDDQINYSGIMLCESVEEAVRQLLTEESNVGLEQSVSRTLARTERNSLSSRQAEVHRSGHHLQSRSGSILILTCRWICACACVVAFQ